ncbi:MAG: choice-of-anchor Q domain-containing protein, partial [Anaerolineales bacterium]
IQKTTFDANATSNSEFSRGGGIAQIAGELFLTNSTFYHNISPGGGGLYVRGDLNPEGASGWVTTGLNHVTIARNAAYSAYGGGLYANTLVNLSVYKSLFYLNSIDAVLSGTIQLNAGGNVISNSPTQLGTALPGLSHTIGELNGATVPVLAGSPVIDFLSSCGEPDDQRGVVRPQDAGCEPGSYEYNGENPPMAPDLPPISEEQLDLGDSSDRCDPFAGLNPSVLTLSLPKDTMVLPVVVRVDGTFPGLDLEAMNGSPLYEYSAILGDLQAYQCSSQGHPDRLICLFNIPANSPGLGLDFELHLNDCDYPVLMQSMVYIPEPMVTCRADLTEEECEAAGGTYQSGRTGSTCICP